jgi:L-ribulose-5-phosphate 4-epimerase
VLEALRNEVWLCNLELPRQGLVKATSGNVSGRDPETGLVVIKPSGYPYEGMRPEDMVVVTLTGKVLEGRLKPSVDLGAHLYVYAHRPDVMGITHTHSTYASVFAALGESIPGCLTASAMLGGEIPLGGYVPIGGDAIGEEMVRKIGNAKAIIMQNHGVFTIGYSASHATQMAVEVEEIAKIVHLAMCRGTPALLPNAAIAYTENLYENVRGQG